MKKIIFVFTVLLFSTTSLFAQAKLSGKTFFDLTYNPDGSPTNEFELHRVYIGYSANISDDISYKVTTDIGRVDNGNDDRLSVYLKNASISWKTSIGKLVVGLQGMNVFKIQEGNWGYRFIEKSAMDKNKFSSSADLGFGYYNKFGKKFNFSAIISNGTGYKKSENDDYKKLSFQLYYGDSKISKDGNFNIGAVFSTEAYDYTTETDETTENKTVFGGFASYKLKNLKVGAEYDIMTDGGKDVSKNIISAYANYSINKMFDVFARFDNYDPNTDTDKDGSVYFIGGFNYKAAKGLYVAPNVRVSSPEEGESTTIYKLNFQFKI